MNGGTSLKLDALIFIDTNILLDFYRIRRSDISMEYLNRLEDCKDRLILGSQVEMEYKKNRQKVILETLNRYSKPDWNKLTPPTLLAASQAAQQIEKHKKQIETQQKKINHKIEQILGDPSRHDPVYKHLQRIFKHSSEFNLNRLSKARFGVRRLARKRFTLGYPPRKDNDISIGDAVNWEWIIDCAQRTTKDIIIVTRDTDFGAIYNGKSYLNDWLKIEFQERVSKKRKLVLTDKLSFALKAVDEVVTKEMEDAEQQLLDTIEWLNSQLFKNDDEDEA
ncbi:PIN domain-containing protein [Vibrio parahaemolyticus]|uniref:DUF4935 domain-containing protein n=1 Tax=Vibrio parahaemolyticus TaxID=670 RepID=A0A9Q3UAQ9_VIBPH|nr:PIN domain-containing protein [Vibrio parahaemolyticus]CAH8210196.1 conserved hypothetical protein [Vibrio aestuarianus]EGQ7800941.1 DUF4935 domain-containing protein [Vibrio parahaemolyticus]EGU0150587.1 DUF4935 domain-containing protein [Vibrio parahaemolyticus]EJX5611335.1 DUF4935 domain-containing protein [Vibrio parahaemolyticus]MCC3783608.1 DUF4935 domain-containing protein [Vibrio parahaemolyticus]